MSNKKWNILPEAPGDFAADIAGLDKISRQLLYNRNLKDKEEIESFLEPSEKDFFDPFLFKDMPAVVDLIIEHIKKQSNIVVYGDYDVDGVTSSSLLLGVIRSLKGNADIYIPERKSEGYGLNKNAIDFIAEGGADLIISVDCGIKNKEEVEYAKSRGLDIIITDHHTAPENESDLPDCLIVNPKTPGEKYPFDKLAGVGVAFKVAEALISKAKLDDELKKRLLEKNMDLLAIGTVADCVELVGENRSLLVRGLEILDSSGRLGLRQLMETAKINQDKKIESWNIGFQIAPRLNAAGRMKHANTAFELLLSDDMDEAKKLSAELNKRNTERQEVTEEIIKEIEKNLNKQDSILVAISPNGKIWEEGVVGLVAGRLTEKYYKPCLVITKTEEDYKGSGRSIDELNIIDLLDNCRDSLEKYGGHAKACGFSVSAEKIDEFIERVKAEAKKELEGVELKPKIDIEADLDPSEISVELAENIARFAPFGEANPAPILLSRGLRVMDKIKMGADGQHLKMLLKSDSAGLISALGFWQTEKWKDIEIDDIIDIVYTLENNHFNGRVDPQMRIVDIKTHNS